MKKLVVFCYLVVMIGLFALNQVQLNGFEYTEKFDLVVESKKRAPQGAKWIISNDTEYMYGNSGEAGYIFEGLKYGDVLSVRTNNQNLIVSLEYEGEQIYTVEDYEKGVESSAALSYKIMLYISIGFLVLMFYLIRRSV